MAGIGHASSFILVQLTNIKAIILGARCRSPSTEVSGPTMAPVIAEAWVKQKAFSISGWWRG